MENCKDNVNIRRQEWIICSMGLLCVMLLVSANDMACSVENKLLLQWITYFASYVGLNCGFTLTGYQALLNNAPAGTIWAMEHSCINNWKVAIVEPICVNENHHSLGGRNCLPGNSAWIGFLSSSVTSCPCLISVQFCSPFFSRYPITTFLFPSPSSFLWHFYW